MAPLAEGGDGTGFIACRHASCAGRTQEEFREALGVREPAEPVLDFGAIPVPPIPPIPTSLEVRAASSGYDEAPATAQTPKPSAMAPEAFRGLLGEAVELYAPCCEASREALLRQTLVALSAVPDRAGVRIGRREPGGSALQLVLVGETAGGRKGTAWSYSRALVRAAFPAFVDGVPASSDGLVIPAAPRMLYGLSSGEGLVNAIRDARVLGKDVDPGVDDKRLLVVLEEFSLLLKIARREGNVISEILRAIHDGGALQFPTKREPLFASRSHVAAVAHVTAAELTQRLDATELVNGAMNRWLLAYVERGRVDADPRSRTRPPRRRSRYDCARG